MQGMNINLRPKKCSGQSHCGRYSSYATALEGAALYLITPMCMGQYCLRAVLSSNKELRKVDAVFFTWLRLYLQLKNI